MGLIFTWVTSLFLYVFITNQREKDEEMGRETTHLIRYEIRQCSIGTVDRLINRKKKQTHTNMKL